MGPTSRLPVHAVPPAPRQPSPATRALLFRYPPVWIVLRILGLVFLLVGLLVAVPFNRHLPADLALDLRSLPASAEVTDIELTSTRINRVVVRRVHFRFALRETVYEGASTTRDSAIHGLPIGTRVPIEYSPTDPSLSRIRGTTLSPGQYMTLLMFILPLTGALLLFLAWRSRRRTIHAFTHGLPTEAQVTHTGPDLSVRINDQHPLKITWAFQVDGKPYTGSLSHLSPQALAPLLNRPTLTVLYDPTNPRVNTVWVP